MKRGETTKIKISEKKKENEREDWEVIRQKEEAREGSKEEKGKENTEKE